MQFTEGNDQSYYVVIGDDEGTTKVKIQKQLGGKGGLATGNIFAVEEDELKLG